MHAHGVNLGALIGMRVVLIGMYRNCEIPTQVDPKSKSNRAVYLLHCDGFELHCLLQLVGSHCVISMSSEYSVTL